MQMVDKARILFCNAGLCGAVWRCRRRAPVLPSALLDSARLSEVRRRAKNNSSCRAATPPSKSGCCSLLSKTPRPQSTVSTLSRQGPKNRNPLPNDTAARWPPMSTPLSVSFSPSLSPPMVHLSHSSFSSRNRHLLSFLCSPSLFSTILPFLLVSNSPSLGAHLSI